LNKTLSEIRLSLRRYYGTRELVPHHDPLSELILTILSQNTSDSNSRPAFQKLKSAFPDLENLVDAPEDRIATAIEKSGLAKIKAARIKESLIEIINQRGNLDLRFLSDMPVKSAREWLTQLPGVGNKTAGCVLLFALGRPAMPVDTHIFRISKRTGLIPENTRLDRAHLLLEDRLPAEDIYELHILLIEHGRSICTARNPHCAICPLNVLCEGYKSGKIHGRN